MANRVDYEIEMPEPIKRAEREMMRAGVRSVISTFILLATVVYAIICIVNNNFGLPNFAWTGGAIVLMILGSPTKDELVATKRVENWKKTNGQ